ncbi:hypothetical protein [Paenibacillus xylanexedens]|uniref:hypothetical protein n=1 Tax=Paenibacillus xylanexedens TaxID=528191 RepID=UPI0011A26D37|nr:hypothetical protein [Paenibacillus xylanexedens]
METDLNVPLKIISNGKTEEFVLLETQHKHYEEELWESENKLIKLFNDLSKIVHPKDRYGHSFAYNYEYFRERKAWREALLMQDYINEVVEIEGKVQELNAHYIETREKLRGIYQEYGITDVVI